jgi:hypothetical protein
VIVCSSCKHYQLGFGTTAVSFAPSDYAVFKRQVKYYKEQTENSCAAKGQKRVSLNIFSHSSQMVLYDEEVQHLSELIAQAVFTEQMESIFEDIKLARE